MKEVRKKEKREKLNVENERNDGEKDRNGLRKRETNEEKERSQ